MNLREGKGLERGNPLVKVQRLENQELQCPRAGETGVPT
jgi:hypothetical protein